MCPVGGGRCQHAPADAAECCVRSPPRWRLFPGPKEVPQGVTFLEQCTDHVNRQSCFYADKMGHLRVESLLSQQKTQPYNSLHMALSLSDTKIVSNARKSLRMACLSFSRRPGVGLIRTEQKSLPNRKRTLGLTRQFLKSVPVGPSFLSRRYIPPHFSVRSSVIVIPALLLTPTAAARTQEWCLLSLWYLFTSSPPAP